MNENHVVYQPSSAKLLRVDHWEVWNGLPSELEFKEKKVGEHSLTCLLSTSKQLYVYVAPDAVELLKKNQKVQLLALGSRSTSGMDFVVKNPGSDDPVEFAKDDNAERLAKIRKKQVSRVEKEAAAPKKKKKRKSKKKKATAKKKKGSRLVS